MYLQFNSRGSRDIYGPWLDTSSMFHPCWFIYERDELFAPSIRGLCGASIRMRIIAIENLSFQFLFLNFVQKIVVSFCFLIPKKSTMRGKFSRLSVHFHNFSKISNQHSNRSNNNAYAFITDMNLLTPQLRVPRLCNNDTNPRIRKITRFVKINHPLSILISLSPRKKIPNIPKIEGR